MLDNGEFAIVGKYMVKDKNEVQDFIDKNNLTLVENNNKPFNYDNVLSKENQIDYSKKSLYYLSARSVSNTWYYLINKDTGELWVEVDYPDASGDNP